MIGGRKWRPGRADGTPEEYADTLKQYAEQRTDTDLSLEYGENEQTSFFERYDEKTDELLLLNDGEFPEKTCLSTGERLLVQVLGRNGKGYGDESGPQDGWELAGTYAWARGLTEEEVKAVGGELNQTYWGEFRDAFSEYTSDGIPEDTYDIDADADADAVDVQADVPEAVAYDGGIPRARTDPEAIMGEVQQEAAPTMGDALHAINEAAPLTIWDNLTVSEKYVRARMGS